MLEAETQFRRIIGYKTLAQLALAVELDVAAGHVRRADRPPRPSDPTTAKSAATLPAAH